MDQLSPRSAFFCSFCSDLCSLYLQNMFCDYELCFLHVVLVPGIYFGICDIGVLTAAGHGNDELYS